MATFEYQRVPQNSKGVLRAYWTTSKAHGFTVVLDSLFILHWFSWRFMIFCYVAIEHGHKIHEFSHKEMVDLSIVMIVNVCQRVDTILSNPAVDPIKPPLNPIEPPLSYV